MHLIFNNMRMWTERYIKETTVEEADEEYF